MAALGDDGSITSTSPASVALGSDYVEFKADLAGPIHGATPGALFYDGQARLVFAIAAQRPALEGDTLLVTYRLSLAADFIRV